MSDCQQLKLLPGLPVTCHGFFIMHLVICLLFVSVMNAYAGEQLNFDQQIERLKKAKKVSVIVSGTPSDAIGNTKDQTRDSLRKLETCYFYVTNQSETRHLIANFKQLDIRKVPHAESFLPYVNIAINFDFANGEQTKLLIGSLYPNESTVDGEMYIHSQSASYTFVINKMIHRDIRRWLVNNGQMVDPTSCGHPRYCGSVAAYCRYYVKADYFRSKPNQTCKVSDFDRPIPDYCERGWEPSYNVKEIN